MELEIINKLYLELSQIATAKTAKELEMDGDLLACYRAFCQESSPWSKAEAKRLLKKRFGKEPSQGPWRHGIQRR